MHSLPRPRIWDMVLSYCPSSYQLPSRFRSTYSSQPWVQISVGHYYFSLLETSMQIKMTLLSSFRGHDRAVGSTLDWRSKGTRFDPRSQHFGSFDRHIYVTSHSFICFRKRLTGNTVIKVKATCCVFVCRGTTLRGGSSVFEPSLQNMNVKTAQLMDSLEGEVNFAFVPAAAEKAKS